jgi:hypothetical protein
MNTKKVKGENHDLEFEVGRLRDTLDIQNLMSRYEYLHTFNDHETIAELFAKKQPDTFISIGTRGHWVGKDAALRAFGTFIKMGPTPGLLCCNPITTPLIEVAGDRKTAKAMWVGTGLMAQKDEKDNPSARIEWDRYAVDFIREDGKWKFWHMQIFRIFHMSWQEWSRNDEFRINPLKVSLPIGKVNAYDDSNRPDGPSISMNPYSLETVQNKVPSPPEPYETWDDAKTYGLSKK